MSESQGNSLAFELFNIIKKHLGATEQTQSRDLGFWHKDKNTLIDARHIKERPNDPLSMELTREEITCLQKEACDLYRKGGLYKAKDGKIITINAGNMRVIREATVKSKAINNGLRSPSYLELNTDEQSKYEQ